MTDLRRLQSEVFHLAYHLHWGWGEIMELGMDERHAYLALLSSQLEREAQSVKRAGKR